MKTIKCVKCGLRCRTHSYWKKEEYILFHCRNCRVITDILGGLVLGSYENLNRRISVIWKIEK